jgi:hypothetical protein
VLSPAFVILKNISLGSNDGFCPVWTRRRRLLYTYCQELAPTAMLALPCLRYPPCAGAMVIKVLARAGTERQGKNRSGLVDKRRHVRGVRCN